MQCTITLKTPEFSGDTIDGEVYATRTSTTSHGIIYLPGKELAVHYSGTPAACKIDILTREEFERVLGELDSELSLRSDVKVEKSVGDCISLLKKSHNLESRLKKFEKAVCELPLKCYLDEDIDVCKSEELISCMEAIIMGEAAKYFELNVEKV